MDTRRSCKRWRSSSRAACSYSSRPSRRPVPFLPGGQCCLSMLRASRSKVILTTTQSDRRRLGRVSMVSLVGIPHFSHKKSPPPAHVRADRRALVAGRVPVRDHDRPGLLLNLTPCYASHSPWYWQLREGVGAISLRISDLCL